MIYPQYSILYNAKQKTQKLTKTNHVPTQSPTVHQVLLEGVEAKRPFTVLFGGIYVVTVTFLPPAQNNNSDVFTPSAAE